MSVKLRQEIERLIVAQVIDSALAAGYQLSVDDGKEITLKRSTNKEEILKAMFTTDEDHLYFSKPEDPSIKGSPLSNRGWVYFVYGNDGYDVISDHTLNLEEVLKEADQLADYFAN